MEHISSKENLIIKNIKKLKEKKYREEKKQFFIEGLRFVSEALESNFQVSAVFISEDMVSKFENLNIKTKTYSLSKQVFKEICSTENPQGIAALVKYNNIQIKHSHGFYILIDKVQDPGNLGTIIRSAHASNALGVIITKGTVDVYNDKTLRATMGSIFHIPIIQDDDLMFLKEIINSGYKLVVSTLESNNNFFNIDLTGDIIIAVGNEGAGISTEIMELSSIKVKIPMPGGAESLNVSAAASVMMFEVVRQNSL